MRFKKSIVIAVLSLIMPLGFAQPQDQAPQPQGMRAAGGQGMGGPRVTAGTGQKPMMQRLRALRTDVDAILSTEDPAERQELLEAHRDKLDEAIAMAVARQSGRGKHQGMKGGHGKRQGMKGGHGKHHGMKGGQGGRRRHDDGFHQRVERRLELIQTLVEQVLENQIDH